MFFKVSGDHTRTIQIATPTVGGLMKFAVKATTCLGCKTVLKPTNSVPSKTLLYQGESFLLCSAMMLDGVVCKNCRPRIGEFYQKQTASTSALQVSYSRLWTQCQRCQGSLHQDVLCTSKDCPIFYMRKKAQKDVEDAVAVLERFDNETW